MTAVTAAMDVFGTSMQTQVGRCQFRPLVASPGSSRTQRFGPSLTVLGFRAVGSEEKKTQQCRGKPFLKALHWRCTNRGSVRTSKCCIMCKSSNCWTRGAGSRLSRLHGLQYTDMARTLDLRSWVLDFCVCVATYGPRVCGDASQASIVAAGRGCESCVARALTCTQACCFCLVAGLPNKRTLHGSVLF